MILLFKTRNIREECELLMNSTLERNPIPTNRQPYDRAVRRGLVTEARKTYRLTPVGIGMRFNLLKAKGHEHTTRKEAKRT